MEFTYIEEEYLATLECLDFPEGTVLPEKLEGEDRESSFSGRIRRNQSL